MKTEERRDPEIAQRVSPHGFHPLNPSPPHPLNPAQRDAVSTLSGPLLVLAGAGTGKTRVITYRMAELIRHGATPDRILSVTFTNKAAREMRERALALLGRRLKQKPLVSTFHALCVRILRQEIAALGYPLNFAIYDRGDQESAARSALREIRVGDQTLRPNDLLARISRWKMAGVSPKEAADHIDNDLDFLASVAYRRYQANLKAAGAVDFDDLLLLTNQLFERFPSVRARHQARFDHVQIDEYQDTNAVQFTLIETLVQPHRNLCVVGDDDQSIYGWRGADVGHILDFQTHFPGAKIVRLQDNYRSTDEILEMANRLVRHNTGRHEKRLVAHKRSAVEVRFLEFEDDTDEAEQIVREITQLAELGKLALGDVAILFRTNEQPRLFETELRRARLPYVLIGGQSFFDRREVRDLMAYLKAIAYPDDEISLLRIINVPARGIGTATVDKLLAQAVKQRINFWESAAQSAAAGELKPKAAAAIDAFRALLERYRARFAAGPRTMDATLTALVKEIGYEDEIAKQYKTPEQQLARSAVVESFVNSVAHYRERAGEPSLIEFLEESALLGRDEEADKDDQLSQNAIKLMTLHSAKGLEFPLVYMVGMEEGLLPHRRSLEGADGAIAEERRLAYVGITRAMDCLTLSRAASRMKWGKRRPSIPSRFLFEMQNGRD